MAEQFQIELSDPDGTTLTVGCAIDQGDRQRRDGGNSRDQERPPGWARHRLPARWRASPAHRAIAGITGLGGDLLGTRGLAPRRCNRSFWREG